MTGFLSAGAFSTIPDDLLFQYNYENTGDNTTVDDSTGNNNHGSAANNTSTVSYTTDSVEGQNALNLSTDTSIDTGQSFYQSDFTIMTWAYADTANLSGESDIYNEGSDRAILSWEKINSNGFEFGVLTDSNGYAILDLDQEQKYGDQWVFLVGKHEANNTNITFGTGLPGESIVYESLSYGTLSTNSANAHIGSDDSGSDQYAGRLDATAVKTSIIPDSEVAAYKSATNDNL